jgi:uncharacterized protein
MITPGYLALHSQGRHGGRDVALLDVCQDYALHLLNNHGIFEYGVVLKGGTSLRKFRAGNAGRFSTDLDFTTPDHETAELVIDMLDGQEIYGIQINVLDREALRARLEFKTTLGTPAVPAKLELSPRPLWLKTVVTEPISLPVHKGYEFTPSALLVPAMEESIAEKLAAWSRRRKMRDLYDLFWYGQQMFNERLVRRVFTLKVWHDVVREGLGEGPLNPTSILKECNTRKIIQEDIGLLTYPVEPKRWLSNIQQRFQFIADLDPVEQRLTACSPREKQLVKDCLLQLQNEVAKV